MRTDHTLECMIGCMTGLYTSDMSEAKATHGAQADGMKKHMTQLHILDTKYITYYSTDYRRLTERKTKQKNQTLNTQPFRCCDTFVSSTKRPNANVLLARSLARSLPFLQ